MSEESAAPVSEPTTAQIEKTMLDSFYPETAEVEKVEEVTDNVEQDLDVSDEDTLGATEDTDALDEGSQESEEESVEGEQDGDLDEESLVFDISGKEISLGKIKEALDGNLRLSDYTKKTQELAEQRKAFEAEQEAVTGLKATLQTAIDNLGESIAKTKADVDWEYLRENDPSEYLKQKELLVENESNLKEATEATQKLQEEALASTVQSEQALLLETNPEWQDPAVMKDDIAMMNAFIEEAGFTQEESQQLISHKIMNLVRDAAKFHKLQSKSSVTEKMVRKAPKAIKPTQKVVKKTQQKSDGDVFYGTANN